MAEFELIPALDLMDGKVVRLLQGQKEKATTYDRDPFSLLQEFKEAGARRVHIVDLSGAFSGEKQAGLLGLIQKSPLPVELGGGLRNEADVEAALDAGAERVILGTLFLENPGMGADLVKRFGPSKILGALDIKAGFAVGRGWTGSGTLTAAGAGKLLVDAGVKTAAITAVHLDGTLKGPAVQEVRAAAESSGLTYICAGGVSSADDVLRVRDEGGPLCLGVITGRALYDGRLDLKSTIEELEKSN